MQPTPINRRAFLAGSGLSLGSAALSNLLLAEDKAPGKGPAYLLPKAKAKRVIFLCMAGGPSHLETFDYKPKLDEMNGKPMPESITRGQPIAQLQGQKLRVQGHLTKFRRHGQGGQYISDFMPWCAKMADDISIVRSLVTEQINHDPAHTFMNTGTAINGRPSMGAWVNYGLGTPNQDLPGYVVIKDPRGAPVTGGAVWGNGYLPASYQGTVFRSSGSPILNLNRPEGLSRPEQRKELDLLKWLNEQHLDSRHSSADLEARIAKGYPLRKLGVPEDIGKVVAFLASDGASHITGQTISVSGGYTMA